MKTLRLLQAYRGYGPGAVIQATPGLAEVLVSSGVAVLEEQRAAPAGQPEQAVGSGQRVETR